MNIKDIVRKAWQATQIHLKKLIWLGAIPAFFGTVVSSVYMGYQLKILRDSALSGPVESIDFLDDVSRIIGLVIEHPGLATTFIIISIFILAGNFLLPPIFRGTLIHSLMRVREYKPMSGSLEIGIRRFFPMFEFSLLTGSFSIITVFSQSIFILRWWGQNVFFISLPILLFVALVGLIASFLFTYSEYYIVLQNKRLIESISESSVLVLANFKKTVLIFILMILIAARAILNVILILLIPLIVVLLTGYFAASLVSTLGIVILASVSLSILALSSYLLGFFNVFATAVWVFSFCELVKKNTVKPVPID